MNWKKCELLIIYWIIIITTQNNYLTLFPGLNPFTIHNSYLNIIYKLGSTMIT